jgi:hypothetical protein
MAPKPFDETLAVLRAEDLENEKKIAGFHLRKNKWRISSCERIGPVYVYTGAAGETAAYAFAGHDPIYLGPRPSDEVLALIQQVNGLQQQLVELRMLLNGAQHLAARKLRASGMTTRQTGAALDLVQGRIWQLTHEGQAQ